jgi:mersacidin/lichenicidin family type 2 lantibiotic
MSPQEIIRAWKDKEYRLRMSESDRAKLPPHPAGILELANDETGGVVGGLIFNPSDKVTNDGCTFEILITVICCTLPVCRDSVA